MPICWFSDLLTDELYPKTDPNGSVIGVVPTTSKTVGLLVGKFISVQTHSPLESLIFVIFSLIVSLSLVLI
jgi:hypothetical protein